MTEDGFKIERTFDAPRDLVWKAFTEPAQFAVWFGGDEGEVPVESVAMDVRPGGAWEAHMSAGGREIDWSGDYVEVDEPARLVFTITDEPGDGPREVITVTFADNGGKTDMTYHQGGGGLDETGYGRAKAGTSIFLDRLEQLLAGR